VNSQNAASGCVGLCDNRDVARHTVSFGIRSTVVTSAVQQK
jgi:hypothetical protein